MAADLHPRAQVLQALGERGAGGVIRPSGDRGNAGKAYEPQLRVVAGELLQECGKASEAELFRASRRAGIRSCPPFERRGSTRPCPRDGPEKRWRCGARVASPVSRDVLLHLIGAGRGRKPAPVRPARQLPGGRDGSADHRVLIPAATMLHYCDGIDPRPC